MKTKKLRNFRWLVLGYIETDFIDSIAKEVSKDSSQKNYKDDHVGIEKVDGSIKIKHLSKKYIFSLKKKGNKVQTKPKAPTKPKMPLPS